MNEECMEYSEKGEIQCSAFNMANTESTGIPAVVSQLSI